jgi:hypothetical protein
MDTAAIAITTCVALYLAFRMTLRFYFPPDTWPILTPLGMITRERWRETRPQSHDRFAKDRSKTLGINLPAEMAAAWSDFHLLPRCAWAQSVVLSRRPLPRRSTVICLALPCARRLGEPVHGIAKTAASTAAPRKGSAASDLKEALANCEHQLDAFEARVGYPSTAPQVHCRASTEPHLTSTAPQIAFANEVVAAMKNRLAEGRTLAGMRQGGLS